jgi:hypothetical protein
MKGSSYGLIYDGIPALVWRDWEKTTKNLSKDKQSTDRKLNLGPPENEAGFLTIWPGRSVRIIVLFHT